MSKPKGPWRNVVAISERLSCGHHIVIRGTDGRSGRFDGLMVHSKRHCDMCLRTADPVAFAREVDEETKSVLTRLNNVLALLEARHKGGSE